MESKTNNYKTQSDICNFKEFLQSDNDDLEIENIPDQQLEFLKPRFLIIINTTRKKQNF